MPDARAVELTRLRGEPITISRSSNLRPEPFDRDQFVAAVSSLSSRLTRDLGAGYAVSIRPARPGRLPPRPFACARSPRASSAEAKGFRRRAAASARRAGSAAGIRAGAARAVDPASAAKAGTGRAAGGPGGPRERGGPGGTFGGGQGPPPGRELDVTVTLPDGGEVAFRTDVPRAGPPLPGRIFVELGLLTLALGAVLYLVARTITRPLTASRAPRTQSAAASVTPRCESRARASCAKRRTRST